MHDGAADLAIFGYMQDGNLTEAKPYFNLNLILIF